jgi:cytochrome P450 PksS
MQVDISSAAFKADPFPFYARLRATAPVHPVTQPDGRTGWWP